MRVLLVAVLLMLALPAVARAQVQEAGSALRKDPVYVDPNAELAGQVDADALREKIRDAGTPIYVAVLPGGAAASPEAALRQVHDAVGLSGTYAVVAGHSFRAGSDLYSAGADA